MALYPRLIEQRIADAMSDTRVVLIVGPRQSGKTTLAKKMANCATPFETKPGPESQSSETTSWLQFWPVDIPRHLAAKP